MPEPLFSTYSTGENRVTSSTLAVFERIEVFALQQILGALAEDTTLPFIKFVNQIKNTGHSVPDGQISGNFDYRFELKIKGSSVVQEQLKRHLKTFPERDPKLKYPPAKQILFVISPDLEEPSEISKIGDPRIIWCNFRSVDAAISDIVQDETSLVSDRTQYLLKELQKLYEQEGLLDNDDIVIIPARTAYPEYNKLSAYICQENRSFRKGIARVGFYFAQAIQPELAKILATYNSIHFCEKQVATFKKSADLNEKKLATIIESKLADNSLENGFYKVILLSPKDDSSTETLNQSIKNDKKDKNGKTTAWTMRQRYTSLEKLQGNTLTSDIEL